MIVSVNENLNMQNGKTCQGLNRQSIEGNEGKDTILMTNGRMRIVGLTARMYHTFRKAYYLKNQVMEI